MTEKLADILKEAEPKKLTGIRNLDPDMYHEARMAALKAKENIGHWITMAIWERLNREKGG